MSQLAVGYTVFKMANKTSKESTKDRIIESAKKLFADQGYQKTTIVDISKQAGLSEAALYEYFQGKEDLLLAIPHLWVSELLQDLEEQLFGIQGAANKLRKFLWWNLRRIEEAPLDAKIVYLFLKTNANFMKTEVYDNVKKLYATLIDIFEEGRTSGEMRADLNAYAARDIFVGTMDHIVIRWLLKDQSYSLFDNLEEIFNTMMKAFTQNHSTGLSKPIPSENFLEQNVTGKTEVQNSRSDDEGSTSVSQGG